MKKLLFLFFILMHLAIQASFNINTDVLNVNNFEQVMSYELFTDAGIILPRYLSKQSMLDNQEYIRIDELFDANNNFKFPVYFRRQERLENANKQTGLALIVDFLAQKYNQLKETQRVLESIDPDNEDIDLVVIDLDYILSVLNKLADVARQTGNNQLYHAIQQEFFS